MRFSIEVHDTEVPQLLDGLIHVTGIEPWKRRFEWLMPQRPFRVENMAEYELVAFAAGTVRSYERLSASGGGRLRGILLDGLKEDKGLSSVQHEITTAVHLMSRGFDVEFHDMEHGGDFDFVARKEDVETEVECKMFSADLGRKIHRRRSSTLCKALGSVLSQTYGSASVGMIVTVAIPIPDRLTPSPEQHRGI